MTRGRAATRSVALIRAINVRGHQTLRMEGVRATFAAAGCASLRTCIQSGNVIFECARASPAAIRRRIQEQFSEQLDAEPEIVLRGRR